MPRRLGCRVRVTPLWMDDPRLGRARVSRPALIHQGCPIMKTLAFNVISAAVAILASLGAACVQAAGFQHGFVADPAGKPLEVGIWYPAESVARSVTMGPTSMSVAVDGTVRGNSLPLVVMSHGTGGSFLSHFDTAMTLADAGFVVVAVTHTGDHHADQSRSMDVMDRPRQVSRVVDHMLSTWDGRGTIDPARIGMFGFSAGGFTTLVSVGGIPDFSKVGPMCRQYPDDFACRLIAKSSGISPAPPMPTARLADPRIKAVVVAAPALGFAFSPDGLKDVQVPVQLWRAENDVMVPHPRYAEAVRLALPIAPDYHVVPQAGHFDFLAPCSNALASLAPAICVGTAGFDRTAFHASFNSSVLTFLTRALGVAPKT